MRVVAFFVVMGPMSIQTAEEFERLREVGRVVRMALDAMAAAVRPGVSTGELDAICERVFAEQGAEAGPRKEYGFPGAACISVNEEALHGIPGERVLEEGDLVKLDVTAEKDGYFGDAAVTVGVGRVSEQARKLQECTAGALERGLQAAKAGHRVSAIGRAVEREVGRYGFRVMKEYCGHGIGRAIHEEPTVPNHFDARYQAPLRKGMVLTIEPIVSAGSTRGRVMEDAWTICSRDGSLAAHFEQTVVITEGAPILLTVA